MDTNKFEENNLILLQLIEEWENRLLSLSESHIITVRNSQNRTIKQLVGHLIDSASNNTHRFIHLQYQDSPLIFPCYSSFGNNDKWIDIQKYQSENWKDLVQFWKLSNKHIIHVIRNVDADKLKNEWITASGNKVSLESMIFGYLPHFKLHLKEIDELIKQND